PAAPAASGATHETRVSPRGRAAATSDRPARLPGPAGLHPRFPRGWAAMRGWKAVALTSGTRAYWALGATISTILTARFLGPQGRGVIAAVTSWVLLFSTCGHLSLAHVVIYLAGGRERARRLPVVTGSALALTGTLALVGWAVAAGLYLLTAGRLFHHLELPVLLIAFAGLPLALWIETRNSLLALLGDLRRLNVAQALGTTTGLLLVVLLVGLLHGGVEAALLATLASYVVGAGTALVGIVRASRPLAVSRAVVGELLAGGARLHPA